jgi:hypothetical protein
MRMVIWLQTPTVFWLGGGTISPSCRMYIGLMIVRDTEIYITEPIVPEPNMFEVELAIEKLKSHKSPVLIKSQQN